jgi:hypothetical protein
MIDPTTLDLIERIDTYEQGIADGDVPNDESLRAIQDSLVGLIVGIWEQTSNYFGFPCTESDCPIAEIRHDYGDESCGFEFKIEPKA